MSIIFSLHAISRVFQKGCEKKGNTFIQLKLINMKRNPLYICTVSNSKTVRTVIHSYLQSFYDSIVCPRRFRNAQKPPVPGRKMPGGSPSVSRHRKIQLRDRSLKSTWIGSSILLSPGAPGCVFNAARKARRKCTYCARSLPRFRNRARADLERFQRRGSRDYGAIAE